MTFLKTSLIVNALFVLVLSLLLSGCQQPTNEREDIPVLSDSTIRDFTIQIAYDYYSDLDKLFKGFDESKGEGYKFVEFRNRHWTRRYTDHKYYYAKVLEKNKDYLASSKAAPIFEQYEKMIYVGLYLKNSLLKDDPDMKEEAFSDAEKGRIAVNQAVKNINSQFK